MLETSGEISPTDIKIVIKTFIVRPKLFNTAREQKAKKEISKLLEGYISVTPDDIEIILQ